MAFFLRNTNFISELQVDFKGHGCIFLLFLGTSDINLNVSFAGCVTSIHGHLMKQSPQ